jgi:hypothetical protein
VGAKKFSEKIKRNEGSKRPVKAFYHSVDQSSSRRLHLQFSEPKKNHPLFTTSIILVFVLAIHLHFAIDFKIKTIQH